MGKLENDIETCFTPIAWHLSPPTLPPPPVTHAEGWALFYPCISQSFWHPVYPDPGVLSDIWEVHENIDDHYAC